MASAAEQLAANMNVGAFARATELHKRLWFTLGALIMYRLGTFIPIPGIDLAHFEAAFSGQSKGILGMFNMFSGGAVQRMAIFSLNVMPYISASIIVQLMGTIYGPWEKLRKEGGEAGRKTLNQYTRYLAVFLALVQSFGIAIGLQNSPGLVDHPGVFFILSTMATLSGGTFASGMATMVAAQRDAAVAALLTDPFALTPGFAGPAQPDGNTAYEDPVTGSWVGAFMMAGINTKAVHRSNFLLGHPWGRDFQYDEMLMLPGPPKSGGTGGGGGGFSFGGAKPPQPGEGPSRAEREAGSYDILFIAEYPDGRTVRASVKGDMDPGYGSTSKILAESALALAFDVSHTQTPGGCWTSSSAMADALLTRLPRHAGVTFTIE